MLMLHIVELRFLGRADSMTAGSRLTDARLARYSFVKLSCGSDGLMVVREISGWRRWLCYVDPKTEAESWRHAKNYPAICGWHTQKFLKENNARCFQPLTSHFGAVA
jgi:hypothetical protein